MIAILIKQKYKQFDHSARNSDYISSWNLT